MSSYQITRGASGGGGEDHCHDFIHLFRLGFNSTSVTWDNTAPEKLVWSFQRQQGTSISFDPSAEALEISEEGVYSITVTVDVAQTSATETVNTQVWLTEVDPPPYFPPIIGRLVWEGSTNTGLSDVKSFTLTVVPPPGTSASSPYRLFLTIFTVDGPPSELNAPVYRSAHWLVQQICDSTVPTTVPSYGGGS